MAARGRPPADRGSAETEAEAVAGATERDAAARAADHAAIDRLADELLPALSAKLAASGLAEIEVREGDWRIRLRAPAADGIGSPSRRARRAAVADPARPRRPRPRAGGGREPPVGHGTGRHGATARSDPVT